MRTLITSITLALLAVITLATPMQASIQQCDSLLDVAIKASDDKDYIYALELLNEAQEIATQENAYTQLFWIYTNIGICYAELLDYNTAIDNLSKAFDIASAHLDDRYKNSVYNNIAGVYMIDKKYDKALEQCKLAYNDAIHRGDSIFIGGCAINIANASLNLGDMEQTAQYLEIADKMLTNYPEHQFEYLILNANYCREQERYHDAYDLTLKAINNATKYNRTAMVPSAMIALSQTMLDIKDYRNAIKHAKDALKLSVNIEERRRLYEILAQCYYQSALYKQACTYKDSVVVMSDSIKEMHKELQFSNANIKIDLLTRKNEIEKYRLRSIINYTIIGMGVLIAIFLSWALFNQIAKNRQEKEIARLNLKQEKQQQALLQNQLEEQRAQARLKEERYNHEIELRDKELMSKAMMMANRNDIIANIINTLSNSPHIKNANDPELKRTISLLQQSLDENEAWKDFSNYFEQRNDTFINALKEKHPELNANEIRFLSLVYINLSTKEIASLLNITPEYCKKKRQQIAHKMGFETSKALFSYLSSIA